MSKRWIFTLSVAVALGLIGLLAYTSESVHRVTESPRTITEVARPRIAPVPAEREMGPTVDASGLMLSH
jgi:hypothetical protein